MPIECYIQFWVLSAGLTLYPTFVSLYHSYSLLLDSASLFLFCTNYTLPPYPCIIQITWLPVYMRRSQPTSSVNLFSPVLSPTNYCWPLYPCVILHNLLINSVSLHQSPNRLCIPLLFLQLTTGHCIPVLSSTTKSKHLYPYFIPYKLHPTSVSLYHPNHLTHDLCIPSSITTHSS